MAFLRGMDALVHLWNLALWQTWTGTSMLLRGGELEVICYSLLGKKEEEVAFLRGRDGEGKS